MARYGRGSFDQFSSYQGGGSSGDTPEVAFVNTGGEDDATRLAQSIGNNIQKISQNVNQLDRMVKQIGTTQDSEEIRERVHEITHATNALAKDANKDMQTLAHLPSPSNSQQERQLKMQKQRLTEQFSDALKNFQTVQRNAAEKERASISRARAASSSNYINKQAPLIDLGPGFNDEPQDDGFSRQGYSQTAQVLQMENDVDLNAMKERESAIKQLESDIMDVNQIFKDLGMLVHEQGEVLDSIEANVENTTMHVEEGTKQLAQASSYQSKARRKKCCLIVVVLVILAVVAIILAVVYGGN